MANEVEYTDAEHEAMLLQFDLMHHETRAQTIARLEAALKVAKASKGDDSPLATRTEVVTREVTVPSAAQVEADKVAAKEAKAAAEPAPKARKSRKAPAKAKADAKAVNKQAFPAKAADK